MTAATKFYNTAQQMATAGTTTASLRLFSGGTDTLKLAFYTAAFSPSQESDLVYATTLVGSGSVEVAGSLGYTVGGHTCGLASGTRSGATVTLKAASNPGAVTASGAGFAGRYFVLYDSTASTATCNLLMFWDYGTTITLASGDSVTCTDVTTGYATITS